MLSRGGVSRGSAAPEASTRTWGRPSGRSWPRPIEHVTVLFSDALISRLHRWPVERASSNSSSATHLLTSWQA
eukprot:2232286-Pyramimonas_sp.AAC.2